MEFAARILEGCWLTLCMMAPYLLLGFFLSGLLSVLLPVRWVKLHLASRGKSSVLKSALLGVPLPLCSCGVLPVATWIRRHGASKGATGAFLLATPQTGIDGFLVALSLLGLGFALFIPAAAFVSGVLLGFCLELFPDPDGHKPEPEPLPQNPLPVWKRILVHGFRTIGGDIAVPLLIGILIAGIISSLVEPHALAAVGSGWTAKLLVVAAATPLYVCATASLPIGASLLAAGLSPGTVFVFLMAGPATNAATFTTIGKLIGRREAVVYLLGALLCALGAGTVLDLFLPELDMPVLHCHDHEMNEWWRQLSAVALVLALIVSKWARVRAERSC